ncbi:MAG: DUF1311 domain-containing protein [Gammaproteobacteria bacterium]|nr:DUF1311 domain-containing protein [Gammaproteobacteria bacterium]
MKNICKSISILLLLTSAGCAGAASFDCSKAQSKVEHMICSSPDLSSLDDAMALDYFVASESDGTNKHQLAKEQLAWLAQRDRCQDEACIQDQYQKQPSSLDAKECDFYTGGASGNIECSNIKLDILNKVLKKLQKRYEESVMKEYNTPDNFEIQPDQVKDALIQESKAWKNYTDAKCWLYGINEGGSFGWKDAFSQICIVDETYKRIKQLKGEIKENMN